MRTRKFKPDQEMTAVVAITRVYHADHGTAVPYTKGKRRCLLLDTVYRISDDEDLWLTLASWARFQPRRLEPCEKPGRLMYPAEVSDVFEKYLDCLLNLSGHPDFVNESSFSHDCMSRFSAALSTMNLDGFQPFVAAEASYTEVQIAGDASISRLRPIKDDIDFWGDRSSPSTDTGPSEPQ